LQPSVNVVPVAMITGGVVSSDHVTVREVDAVFPQASVAVKVLVWDLLQVPVMDELIKVTVGVLQPSDAEAVPSAASISAVVGLQPRVNVVPEAMITGAVVLSVQVTERETLELLPQASVDVQVLVCDLVQVPVTGPSLATAVTTAQLSEAVAEPNASLISVAVGLQPNVNVVPVAVITGGVVSSVHVTVREVVAIFPHTSVAVKVLICDLLQVPVIVPSE
jgi:hypothetical protein